MRRSNAVARFAVMIAFAATSTAAWAQGDARPSESKPQPEASAPVPEDGSPEVRALRLLESVDREMSAAERDLRGKKPTDGTRTQQQNAAKHLGELISMIEQMQQMMQRQQRPQPQPSPREPSPTCVPPDRQPGQPQPQPGQPQPMPQNQPDDQGRRRNDGSAQRSVEGADPMAAKKAELLRQQQMLKDVWGHLPPMLRDELLNIRGEQYLPKYADQVERYYEALAERSRRRSGVGSQR